MTKYAQKDIKTSNGREKGALSAPFSVKPFFLDS
jgi:hypothetical protein